MLNLAEVAQEAVARIKETFSAVPLDDVRVDYAFPLDLGTAMGQCKRVARRRYLISLNPNLFLRAPHHEVIETVRHELAHAYDDAIVSRFDHGPSWKMLMKILGYANPRPCHFVATVGLKGGGDRTTVWCSQCKMAIGVRLVTRDRLVRGLSVKKCCPKCNGALALTQ